MKRFIVALLVCLTVCAVNATSFASLHQFSGRWVNVDNDTRGITKLDIDVSGHHATVRAWGQCHPTDCDWGRVTARVYGSDVSSDPDESAVALVAKFSNAPGEQMLIVERKAGNRLEVKSFRHFTDGSGRTDYMHTYTFRRFLPIHP